MAPEQEQGQVLPESDVFALGVCFYEMLSGRLPYAGQGTGLLINKLAGKHDPLSGLIVSLPSALDAVMAKVLAPEPEKRYPSPREFYQAIQTLG
jgi:serine/threonine-protein kinase